MTASDPAETTVPELIEEVGLGEKGSSPHETTEAGWHISDNHQQNLSFSDVHPADITVRNLGVEVDVAVSFMDAFKAKYTKPKVGDVEGDAVAGVQRKKILRDVSADFPAGTLTAIIGGSGSGKVRLHSHALQIRSHTQLLNRQPSSTFSLIACGDQTLLSPEAHDTMDPLTFSQSPAPTLHKPMCCFHPLLSAKP